MTAIRRGLRLDGLSLAMANNLPDMKLDLTPGMALPNAANDCSATLTGPAPHTVDRIDLSAVPPPPTGFVSDEPSLSRRAGPLMQPASPEALARVAQRFEPGDVIPLPSNMVDGPDELARIGDGMRPALRTPNEREALPAYSVGDCTRRNPLDLVSWLRSNGGVHEQGGELRSRSVDKKARDLDSARGETMLGRLVRDDGMTLDEATPAAWEAGYFPDSLERPSVHEILDALRSTYMGGPGRVFRPDDHGSIDDSYRLQGECFQVEAGRERGEPLYEDRGQPITQDDLAALDPPAIAYEDLPSAGGQGRNINLDELDTPDDIKRLLQATETRFGGFDAARRGRVSQTETEAPASELGITVDDLLKRRRGPASYWIGRAMIKAGLCVSRFTNGSWNVNIWHRRATSMSRAKSCLQALVIC